MSSPKAQRAYAELLDELAHLGGVLPSNEATTTTELVLAYWTWAEAEYARPDGTPTSEQSNVRVALREWRQL